MQREHRSGHAPADDRRLPVRGLSRELRRSAWLPTERSHRAAADDQRRRFATEPTRAGAGQVAEPRADARESHYRAATGDSPACELGTEACDLGTEACDLGTEACDLGTEACELGTEARERQAFASSAPNPAAY
jgi:hypothetical protein